MSGSAPGVSGGSREVHLSSADRVIFPEDGITKGDLFAYYDAVADALVPHLRDRPFTMKRYREGAAGPAFFQKQAPKGMPSWIPTRRSPTRTREGQTRLVDFPLVNSRDALLWMVQMHCIDMNTWYSRVDEPERPDYVVFDLDPPDGAFALGVQAARLVGDLMREIGLRPYAKASGADGMHVFVPIDRRHSFEEAHAFAEAAAHLLATRHPGVVTVEWLKAKREGVLIDYHQNGMGRTTASVFSVRPKSGATVSMPLHWEELDDRLDRRELTMERTLRRIRDEGDLFAPVLAGGQTLGAATDALAKLAQSWIRAVRESGRPGSGRAAVGRRDHVEVPAGCRCSRPCAPRPSIMPTFGRTPAGPRPARRVVPTTRSGRRRGTRTSGRCSSCRGRRTRGSTGSRRRTPRHRCATALTFGSVCAWASSK